MEHMASALVVYPCFITKHIQFCSFHAVLHYSGRNPGRSAQNYQKYLGIRSAPCLVKYRLGWNVYSHVTMQLSQYKNSYNQRNTNIGSYGTSISYENKTITADNFIIKCPFFQVERAAARIPNRMLDFR